MSLNFNVLLYLNSQSIYNLADLGAELKFCILKKKRKILDFIN